MSNPSFIQKKYKQTMHSSIHERMVCICSSPNPVRFRARSRIVFEIKIQFRDMAVSGGLRSILLSMRMWLRVTAQKFAGLFLYRPGRSSNHQFRRQSFLNCYIIMIHDAQHRLNGQPPHLFLVLPHMSKQIALPDI